MKKLYFLTLQGLLVTGMSAQSFDWAKREGLYEYDYGYGIVNDNSGNVYVAGKYEENANFSGTILPNQGNHDIYLAKYNSSGSLAWVSTGGGKSGDYAHAVACDNSNIYVAGEIEIGTPNTVVFPGSSITLSSNGGNDMVLLKYDLNGNLLWAQSGGGTQNDKAVGVTYDNSGNIYICGLYTGTATFSGTTITGTGQEDIFVAKYDASGNLQWIQTAGSTQRDEPKSIICDASGNVYVCGFYSNGATFGAQTVTTATTSTGTYFETFLAKYNSSGTLQWVKTAGGDYDDVSWSLTKDNAGLLYVAGEYNAYATFGSTGLTTNGNADVFVACYDQSGNVQWAKGFGGSLIDRARGIGCDGNNLFITGQFGNMATFGSQTLVAADSSDIFFASLSNTGNILGAASVSGVQDSVETLGYESGIAICAESTGEVYATGALLNGGVFGSISLSGYSRTDVFITKISGLTNGINDLSAAGYEMMAYPNPSKGVVSITSGKTGNEIKEMSLIDCFGQCISKQTDLSVQQVSVDMSDRDNGVYFAELKLADQRTVRKKIVLQK